MKITKTFSYPYPAIFAEYASEKVPVIIFGNSAELNVKNISFEIMIGSDTLDHFDANALLNEEYHNLFMEKANPIEPKSVLAINVPAKLNTILEALDSVANIIQFNQWSDMLLHFLDVFASAFHIPNPIDNDEDLIIRIHEFRINITDI